MVHLEVLNDLKIVPLLSSIVITRGILAWNLEWAVLRLPRAESELYCCFLEFLLKR